jgi:hypothetical protein
MITPKQERNGVPGPSDDNGGNTAQPSADMTSEFASMASGAQSAAYALYKVSGEKGGE